MVNSDGNTAASVNRLRIGAGFAETERDDILNRLGKLDRRLKRFDADTVDMELSVKGRDTNEQYVTLEAWIAGYERFVATSREPVLKDALMDVRDDMWRQVDDAVNKRVQNRRRPN